MSNPIRYSQVYISTPILPLARDLKYFYVFGNFFSGHVEMYEEVKTRINFKDKDDFVEKISVFVDLQPTTPDILAAPQNIFTPSPIYQFPEFLQPSLTQIKDCPIEATFCFINVGDGFFEISLHGDGKNDRYNINEYSIKAALNIEKIIDKNDLAQAVEHKISEHFNCIRL
ncbi:MAG: hypothetical protein OHK0045_04920 [Raineya sp.]